MNTSSRKWEGRGGMLVEESQIIQRAVCEVPAGFPRGMWMNPRLTFSRGTPAHKGEPIKQMHFKDIFFTRIFNFKGSCMVEIHYTTSQKSLVIYNVWNFANWHMFTFLSVLWHLFTVLFLIRATNLFLTLSVQCATCNCSCKQIKLWGPETVIHQSCHQCEQLC